MDTETLTITNYGIPATEVTQLTLDRDWLFPPDTSLAVLRNTTVFAQGELLVLAEEPVEDEIQGDTIELDSLYDGLESGRWLIVSGERTDIPGTSGVTASEVVMLAGVMQKVQRVELEGQEQDLPDDKTHSFLKLARPLAYRYKRDTVTIYGNVVRATHGETRAEVLGSGDSSKTLQQFSLKQAPLTYVAATTPSGAESTLQVFVDDVRWHEVERLVGLEPTDHRFVTRASDEDEVMLTFGDGKRGARLPTGVENVRAIYRTGIGKPGNVEAKRISQLATRPLGSKDVINPLAATGGAGRESRDQARSNAPLALMALDRLVSVQDYADFARTFAGIGKASAARLSDGYRQLVHLTIAGADDIPIAEDSDLYRNLVQALRQFGDPQQPLRVEIRELIMLIISARVRVLYDYLWESVEPKIRAALLDAFSFERCELGQDALLSEVISTIQRVPGLAYVDVDTFGGVSEKITDDTTGERRLRLPGEIAVAIQTLVTESERDGPQRRVTVGLAGPDGGPIYPAQLAFLTPDVSEAYQRSRWYQGRVVVWLGAQKQTGRGGGASGLRFDYLAPAADPLP